MKSHSVGAYVCAAVLAVSALAVALAGPSVNGVAAKDTAGNNGTVKIHEGPNEPRPEVRNQPHVCTFHLHFFFGDDQQSGSWEIQRWAPGPKGQVVLSGTYDTQGDGEDRQPRSGAYSLPNGHYKLFWDGDTGKHDKHKVFWVKCAQSQPTPTPTPTPGGGGATPTPTPTPTPGGGGATPTPTPTPGGGDAATPTPTPAGGGGAATPTPAGNVGGETGTPVPTLPPTNTLESAQSGGNVPVVLLVLLAIGSIAIGATVLRPRPVRTRP